VLPDEKPGVRALALLDEAIATATAAERPALVVALAARLATVGAGLVPAPQVAAPAAGDENITIEEGARRLGVSVSYLYRNDLPFIVRVGRRRLVNVGALAAYNRGNGR
jgi:hypothetical protein